MRGVSVISSFAPIFWRCFTTDNRQSKQKKNYKQYQIALLTLRFFFFFFFSNGNNLFALSALSIIIHCYLSTTTSCISQFHILFGIPTRTERWSWRRQSCWWRWWWCPNIISLHTTSFICVFFFFRWCFNPKHMPANHWIQTIGNNCFNCFVHVIFTWSSELVLRFNNTIQYNTNVHMYAVMLRCFIWIIGGYSKSTRALKGFFYY